MYRIKAKMLFNNGVEKIFCIKWRKDFQEVKDKVIDMRKILLDHMIDDSPGYVYFDKININLKHVSSCEFILERKIFLSFVFPLKY